MKFHIKKLVSSTLFKQLKNENPPILNNKHCENNTNITNDNRRIYCNKMLALDDIIGNLIDQLKINNLWNDTVILFTTDNGGMCYYANTSTILNIDSWSNNLPFRAGKQTLFNGGVRGNAFISGGNYKLLSNNIRGKNNSILIHAIDWIPTILKGILNLTIWDENDEKSLTGINFWPYIIGSSSDIISDISDISDININIDEINSNRSIYIGIQNNFKNTGGHPCKGIIYKNMKYIYGKQFGTLYYPIPPQEPFGNWSSLNETVFLFNLTSDPYERNNLAHMTQYQQLIQQLQDMIDNAQETMQYMPMQNQSKQAAGNPKYFNNTYSPWIGNLSKLS